MAQVTIVRKTCVTKCRKMSKLEGNRVCLLISLHCVASMLFIMTHRGNGPHIRRRSPFSFQNRTLLLARPFMLVTMDCSRSSEPPGTLVVETNDYDVILGRGRKASNLPGNRYFRSYVASQAPAYDSCGSVKNKHQLSEQVVAHIHSKGGRFVRPVTAADRTGQVRSAWEVVSTDVTLGKVKQAMRDAVATRRSELDQHARASLPSLDSMYGSGKSVLFAGMCSNRYGNLRVMFPRFAARQGHAESESPAELRVLPHQNPLISSTHPQQQYILNPLSQLPAAPAGLSSASPNPHHLQHQQLALVPQPEPSPQEGLARMLQQVLEQQQQEQQRLVGATLNYGQLAALAGMLQQQQMLLAGPPASAPLPTIPQQQPPPAPLPAPMHSPHQQMFGPLGITMQQAGILQKILQAAAADAAVGAPAQPHAAVVSAAQPQAVLPPATMATQQPGPLRGQTMAAAAPVPVSKPPTASQQQGGQLSSSSSLGTIFSARGNGKKRSGKQSGGESATKKRQKPRAPPASCTVAQNQPETTPSPASLLVQLRMVRVRR